MGYQKKYFIANSRVVSKNVCYQGILVSRIILSGAAQTHNLLLHLHCFAHHRRLGANFDKQSSKYDKRMHTHDVFWQHYID